MNLGKLSVNANISGVVLPIVVTQGSTVTLNIGNGGNIATWTATQNQTLVIAGSQFLGQTLTLIIKNDSLLGRSVTFGTGFRSGPMLVGLVSKVAVLCFVSDGTAFYEVSRTTSL